MASAIILWLRRGIGPNLRSGDGTALRCNLSQATYPHLYSTLQLRNSERERYHHEVHEHSSVRIEVSLPVLVVDQLPGA